MEKSKLLELIPSALLDLFFLIITTYGASLAKMFAFTTTEVFALFYLIAFIGSLIGLFFVSRHIYYLLTRPKKESAINFYHRESPKLNKFLNSAKHRIDIFGITLEQTTRGLRPTLEKILEKKEIREVRLILTNPKIDIRDQIERQVDENIGTISSSLQTLKDMRRSLSNNNYTKLHVKLSNEIPVQSIFIIDPDEKHSIIRFEPYIYGIPKENRRIFEMSIKKQKKLYEIYKESFTKLWNAGTDYPI